MTRALLLVCCIAVGATVTILAGIVYSCSGCDYETFAAIGPRVLAGDPLYQPRQMEPYRLIEMANGGGWIYPPVAAVLMTPVQWIPEVAWRVLNLGSLIVVVWLLLRDRFRLAPLLAPAIVLLFPPTWIAWGNGQITPLLAAGFGLAYLYPRWTWWIAAVGGAIKLFPLVLLAWALRERGWRDVGLGVGALVILVLVTLPIVGATSWSSFLEAWSNGLPNCNYAPINSIQCTFGSQPLAYAIAGALVLVSLLVRDRSIAFLLLTVSVVVAAPDLNRPYWLVPLVGMVALVSVREHQLEPLRLDA